MASVACFIALMLAFVSGVYAQDTDDNGPITLSVWQAFKPEETAVFREIMADFEHQLATQTGRPVHVEVSYVAYDDMFTKLRTAALANITPDIACVDSIKVTDLAFGRALVPIDELPAFQARYGSIEDARQEFVNASFDSGVVNRLGETHLYGLPVQTTTVALFWNRQLFREKAGALQAAGLDPNRPPRDWDEMIAYGKVLTDPARGVFGYGMQGSLWFNFPMLNMYGADWIKYAPDGRVLSAIDSPNAAAAMGRLRTLATSGIEGGAWKRSSLNPEMGFINKKYAMVLTGPWMVENFANAGLDFDISLIPAPTRTEIDLLNLPPIAPPELAGRLGPLAWSSSNVGGQTGAIFRSCRHPELAYRLLEYFTSEAVQRRWASTLGQIPVRLAAWEQLDTSKYPFMPRFMDQLRLSRRIPPIPLFQKLELDVFNPEIDLLLQQPEYPIATMLNHMESNLQTMLLDRINEGLESAREEANGEEEH